MVRIVMLLAASVAVSALLAAPAGASTPSSARHAVQRLAQNRDAATCARWRADIQARIDGFSRSCSGPLDPNQAAAGTAEKQRLDGEISQFNSQCSG